MDARCQIGIMGTPISSGNRGVLALCAALVRLCTESGEYVRVALFESQRDRAAAVLRPSGTEVAIPVSPWRMSPRAALREHLFVIVACSFAYAALPLAPVRRRIAAAIPWIGELLRTTVVGDVRGGDSFSDIYGLKRFVLATLPVLSVIAVKGSIIQFPQTYGPFKHPVSRWIARFVLRRSSTIIARDLESQRIAQGLAGRGQTVLLSPDVAFALYAERPKEIRTQPALNGPLAREVVGINVNGLMFNGGYSGSNMFGLKLDYRSFLVRLVTEMAAATSADLLLIPHTFAPAGDSESDNAAAATLRDMVPEEIRSRIRIVEAEYDAHQLKGIIGQCDFFIGSRMHSCIAALSQGVPCVGVAYSMKFRGVFESVEMADHVVDGRECDTEEAIRRTLDLYRKRDSRREGLRNAAGAAEQRLRAVFKELIGGLTGSRSGGSSHGTPRETALASAKG